jgi:hypothetical protein
MEVFFVPCGTIFDAKVMVGELDDRQDDGDVLVLCTTELPVGLRCSSLAMEDQETDSVEEIFVPPSHLAVGDWDIGPIEIRYV